MNWDKLTPILGMSIEKVKGIQDEDERLAMLIFYVAELVESNEREKFVETIRNLA